MTTYCTDVHLLVYYIVKRSQKKYRLQLRKISSSPTTTKFYLMH